MYSFSDGLILFWYEEFLVALGASEGFDVAQNDVSVFEVSFNFFIFYFAVWAF